eukprot:CAMPEP_0182448492 /NCGR_PEP_ID=MMETSP1172-20130603/27498_1 /TAXON_ID=708627 /ORGANISM="Timspurckia oligopyrenoides, Strain CCMP3278" /LENGTH=46 /DNA_ID= /DNA_START= /DNA_END= /DNA_ORIENTATION=
MEEMDENMDVEREVEECSDMELNENQIDKNDEISPELYKTGIEEKA